MKTIRASGPADGDRVVAVWRRAVIATHDFLSASDFDRIHAEVCEFLPGMPLWVAVDADDRPIGFMSLAGCEMEALFVDPDHRGTGVGRALVEHAASLGPSITTTVNEQNRLALGFYERLGFIRTGRSPFDDQGRPYPVLRLALTRRPASRIV